jgi:hypothetical protein
MNVHKGGPVEVERGFVLHSDDFTLNQSTLKIDNGICLTATLEILRAMATGTGPSNSHAGARLRGLGARTAGKRNCFQRLADGACRSGHPV